MNRRIYTEYHRFSILKVIRVCDLTEIKNHVLRIRRIFRSFKRIYFLKKLKKKIK